MRMRGAAGRSMFRKQDGAVLYVVAISLFFLLGMLVLVFDLGRIVAVRRDMVNAADAAALAAARECALGNGLADAQLAAAQLVGVNRDGASVTALSAPECDALSDAANKLVRVEATVQLEYFFAPIFGIHGGPVVKDAIAQWGPVAVARPVPFVAQEGAFQGPCNIPDVAAGVDCFMWFDNDDFGGSTFGTLNLNKWDVPADTDCSDKELGANQHYAAVGGYDGQVPLGDLNWPDPTWVCAGTGNYQPIFGESPALDVPGSVGLSVSVGRTIAFPVTRAPCIRQGSACELFNVVGFARVLLRGVFKANGAPAECGTPPDDSSSHCLVVRWVGGGVGGGGVIGGLDYGLRTVRLVD